MCMAKYTQIRRGLLNLYMHDRFKITKGLTRFQMVMPINWLAGRQRVQVKEKHELFYYHVRR